GAATPGDVGKVGDVRTHLPIAWEHLGGANEPPLAGNRDRYGEAAVDVARSRRNGERLRHGQHGPGPAEGPPGAEVPRRRQITRIALGRTVLHPPGHQRDLLVRKSANVGELTVAWHRFPRRHLPRRDRLADLGAA